LPLLIALRSGFNVYLKRGKTNGKKVILSSRVIAAIAGAGVACALLAAVIINGWNSDALSEDNGQSGSVPLAAGTDSGTPKPNNGNNSSDDPQLTPTDLPGEIPAVDSPNNETVIQTTKLFTDENFEVLRSDPDSYVNSTAAISGKIYEIFDQSTASHILLTFRIHNQAIDSDESRAAVMFQLAKSPKLVFTELEVEDCIAVQGNVRGGLADTNSLGQKIRIPIIDTSELRPIECIDSALPAAVTINSNFSQSYGGITLDVERIQLADGHLRLKISASNSEAGASVYIRDRESHAEYLGKAYESISHLPALVPFKMDSLVPQNSDVSGYLFFEPVEEYSGGTFTFRVVVEKVGISESTKTVFILRV
jgi:hypothetical protein